MTGIRWAGTLTGYYRFHARIYDATRWLFLFGRSGLIDLAASSGTPKRILEVGCGTGANLRAMARRFPKATLTGVDLSPDMLAIARRTTAEFDGRVSLIRRAYREPVADGRPFDLIVWSYCLSMIDPGRVEALRVCRRDLGPGGIVVIVDFHDTPHAWFRRWMRLNHVRLDGGIAADVRSAGLRVEHFAVHSAFGGVWRWLSCVASDQCQR